MTTINYSAADNLEVLLLAKKYNAFLTNEIMQCCAGALSLLDFGSGIGTFPLALRDKGFDVVCIEPDQEFSNQLKASGFKVYTNLNYIPLSSMDRICSLNVLEHIEDDKGTLHLLYERLKPGGIIFIFVPAFNILYSSMDRKVGHIRRYRKKDLCQLLQVVGFNVDKAEYVDSLGFALSLIYKLIGNKKGDLNPAFIKVFDKFIFPVSRIADRIFKHIFGKNLLIVAHR